MFFGMGHCTGPRSIVGLCQIYGPAPWLILFALAASEISLCQSIACMRRFSGGHSPGCHCATTCAAIFCGSSRPCFSSGKGHLPAVTPSSMHSPADTSCVATLQDLMLLPRAAARGHGSTCCLAMGHACMYTRRLQWQGDPDIDHCRSSSLRKRPCCHGDAPCMRCATVTVRWRPCSRHLPRAAAGQTARWVPAP